MSQILQGSSYERAVATLESIYEHRKANPTSPTDLLYYRLIAEYNRRILRAREEGQKVIAQTVYVPNELVYAFDLVPMVMENVSVTTSILLGAQEELLNTAKRFGLPPEVCSNHRVLTAFFLQDWSPAVDAVVWTHVLCDNTAKAGENIAQLRRVPSYFLDRSYGAADRDARYLAGELEGMVHFFQELTGRPLNWDRLEESLAYSQKMVEAQREMDRLRENIPSPMSNRKIYQLLFIHWLYSGSPEGSRFYQEALEEVKAGPSLPPERYRLLSLFVAPNYNWKILDWMERGYGARIVGDPYHCHWGEWEHDPKDPLLSLARKLIATPACRQLHGPIADFVADAVEDATRFRTHAAIYWAHIGCRQACGAIKVVKDALAEVGCPTLVLDLDITDPTFVTTEALKERLEGFFEVLAARAD